MIIYLHGFASGPGSKKAQFLHERFRSHRIELLVPDLSEGDFENLTLTKQLRVIERLADGRPVSLIGSSMGGYLAALYAARHREVERLLLLAPAFGLSRRWAEWLGEDQMSAWKQLGYHSFFHYGEGRERRLSYGIVEDAAHYEDFPDVTQPVLLFHGRADTAVPCALSEEFARWRPNVQLTLLEDGHELTGSLETIWTAARGFFGL
ncbi:MAG TPA: YqiA/YcfP family alpha/beta fold hydrolase [Bryobacteraceae bacterium]|nr:YqiA/YcfP family alpha/beta fold hydrolase [Bryobacteraceae bacterium]HOQ43862.1 YqiA/YcfP family alpha/beta fold hydrolase [Bryobacteraceae bacterium]HPQ15811.1 YqiA/YcfP family alpha/beta fold hydrolase [Bryobacteraceae bacterium]HPU71695.1 YqiA/YcfP family alpha/beta fold hydrolase [Bryobacteraceae bacterium]